jgi:hypothetical protein
MSVDLPAVLLGAEIGHNIRLTVRCARREDLPRIVGMLAPTPTASTRASASPARTSVCSSSYALASLATLALAGPIRDVAATDEKWRVGR